MKKYIFPFILIVNSIFFACNNSDEFTSTEIGNQIWMSKNLNLDKFQNGDIIAEARTKTEWEQSIRDKKPVWCYFDNDTIKGEKYGKLYNWYAIIDPRELAPKGWRLPNLNDVNTLINNSGGNTIGGKKLKSKSGWDSNGNGTDNFGFNILPSGFLNQNGQCSNEFGLGTFWILSKNYPQFVVFDYYHDEININPCDKTFGFYIRCIKK
jgi:uncharacterized protein (TIGR02145 family)